MTSDGKHRYWYEWENDSGCIQVMLTLLRSGMIARKWCPELRDNVRNCETHRKLLRVCNPDRMNPYYLLFRMNHVKVILWTVCALCKQLQMINWEIVCHHAERTIKAIMQLLSLYTSDQLFSVFCYFSRVSVCLLSAFL